MFRAAAGRGAVPVLTSPSRQGFIAMFRSTSCVGVVASNATYRACGSTREIFGIFATTVTGHRPFVWRAAALPRDAGTSLGLRPVLS